MLLSYLPARRALWILPSWKKGRERPNPVSPEANQSKDDSRQGESCFLSPDRGGSTPLLSAFRLCSLVGACRPTPQRQRQQQHQVSHEDVVYVCVGGKENAYSTRDTIADTFLHPYQEL